MKHFIGVLFLSFFMCSGITAQSIGIKTNTLYWATATPNIGLEFRLSPQTSLSLAGGYNRFDLGTKNRQDGTKINAKLWHLAVMPEFKYWFCKAFERSYIGIHGIYADYNAGGISFISPLKDYRYKGNAYGGGLSWGYQWAVGNRWGLETSIGAGYLLLNYKKYECGECGDFIGEYKRNYFGPTKLALSVIYFLR